MHRKPPATLAWVVLPVTAGILAAGVPAGATTSAPITGSASDPAHGWYEVFSPSGRITLEHGRPDTFVMSEAAKAAAVAAARASTVTTIQAAGPASNRYSLVFVGDGYTQAQLGLYASHVTAQWNAMMRVEPFQTYQKFFNGYRVDVVSPVSGVSNDPNQNTPKSTPLGMHFWCHGLDRLLCVDVPTAQKIAAQAPKADMVFALANTTTYGGSGGQVTTVAGGNTYADQITPHELGHAIGGLGDEYDTPYGAGGGAEPPQMNVTTKTSPQLSSGQAKWWRWLGATSPDGGTVGVYAGANYYKSGFNRPTQDSIMRTLGKKFNLPGLEAMVEAFYQKVRPIDSVTPAGGTATRTSTLTVSPVPLVGSRQLLVWWGLDGKLLDAYTGQNTLPLSKVTIPAGRHTVTVSVRDTTDWVRDEAFRDKWMTQTMSWTVS